MQHCELQCCLCAQEGTKCQCVGVQEKRLYRADYYEICEQRRSSDSQFFLIKRGTKTELETESEMCAKREGVMSERKISEGTCHSGLAGKAFFSKPGDVGSVFLQAWRENTCVVRFHRISEVPMWSKLIRITSITVHLIISLA